VVIIGTIRPREFPAHILPTILVLANDAYMTGICMLNSDSNADKKLSAPSEATRQYLFVSFTKTPISLECSNLTLVAINL
jgi:hypothetical protein